MADIDITCIKKRLCSVDVVIHNKTANSEGRDIFPWTLVTEVTLKLWPCNDERTPFSVICNNLRHQHLLSKQWYVMLLYTYNLTIINISDKVVKLYLIPILLLS